MPVGPQKLARYIHRLAVPAEAESASDAALLGRFIAEKDEKAFAAIVDRHGPIVLHVCQRVLGNLHDAEDAFQAAFLVLAHKAASVRPRESLAAWLHGVAHRVALKARSASARRARLDRNAGSRRPQPGADFLSEISARELLAMVDEEVRRLPTVYRLPVILCCLEGRTQEEAARQLGWSSGSIKGRLERGRARLQSRLLRRGLALSALLAASEVSRGAMTTSIMARISATTVQCALPFASGKASSGASLAASALAQRALAEMAAAKTILAASASVAGAVLAIGLWTYTARGPRPAESDLARLPPSLGTERQMAQSTDQPVTAWSATVPEDTPIKVSGRVLGPGGDPVAGAKLYLGYAPFRNEPDAVAHQPAYRIHGRTGADGNFVFDFARSQLDQRYLDASRPVVVAVAEGYGIAWSHLSDTTDLRLMLADEVVIEGRIRDSDGKPVVGAKIRVQDVGTPESFGRFIETGCGELRMVSKCRGPLPGLPGEVTVGADGRFRLKGLARDQVATLTLQGPGIANATLTAVARPSPSNSGFGQVYGASFDYRARASRPIRGVVCDKTTGDSIQGVRIEGFASPSQWTNPVATTDRNGRYELLGCADPDGGPRRLVTAKPQDGQPYFATTTRLSDAATNDAHAVNFDLVRGIPVHGRVVIGRSRKVLQAGVVEYYALFPNPYATALTYLGHLVPASSASVHADGSYSLVALPGPGIVLVAVSPRDSYATALLDPKELHALFPSGGNQSAGSWFHVADGEGSQRRRCLDRYNALALVNPANGTTALDVDLVVEPACGLAGSVIGPDGTPVFGVTAYGLTSMPDPETLQTSRFTIEGMNPQRTRVLSLWHREKGLGKSVTVCGDQTGPLTVRLEPFGVVAGRIVDRAGKPLKEQYVTCATDANYQTQGETDGEGRFELSVLPDVNYRLGVFRGHLKQMGEIRVGPGQRKHLGDVSLDN
jgi:RNA polymerase sigma factor (sigma-70 family)